MTLFEGICIGFAMGVVVTLISIGVMTLYVRDDKGTSDGNRDVDSYNCGNYRNCCGMGRYCKGDDGK